MGEVPWKAEPHTLAKLEILRRYLGAWFSIICQRFDELVYVDATSGPGEYSGGEDGSPLVALDAAKQVVTRSDIRLKCTSLRFWFGDQELKYIEHLRGLVDRRTWPPRFAVQYRSADLTDLVREVLRELPVEGTTPFFTFIDPFGNHAPLVLIGEIMAHPSAEVFLLFSPSDVRRNAANENSEQRRRIEEVWGGNEIAALAPRLDDAALAGAYGCKLRRFAEFVRSFRMKCSPGRTVYFLFFLTNRVEGFVKMKEAMWPTSGSKAYECSDAEDEDQLPLFSSDEDAKEPVRCLLCQQFRDRQEVSGFEVERWVNAETMYLNKHKTAALRTAETCGTVCAGITKADGTRRRKGSFPNDAIMGFGPRLCGDNVCRRLQSSGRNQHGTR